VFVVVAVNIACDKRLNQGVIMSKIMNEIIHCIERDDEFREKYYDDIDRLDELENAGYIAQRIPAIYPAQAPILKIKAKEKDHA